MIFLFVALAGLSLVMIGIAYAYFAVVRPMQGKIARLESDLAALARTVDHNAAAANLTSDRVSSLAKLLAEVAALAENANRHAHSHSRF